MFGRGGPKGGEGVWQARDSGGEEKGEGGWGGKGRGMGLEMSEWCRTFGNGSGGGRWGGGEMGRNGGE